MKFKIFILSLISTLVVSMGHAEEIAEVKVNVAAGAVAIFNPSIELGFARRSAITMDYVGAFAKSDYMGTGDPFMVSMGFFGYRHYLKADSHSGFFAGGDLGLYVFRMNKNLAPLVVNDHGDQYDVGYGFMLGMTLGYKYLFTKSKRWAVEASISGGWQRAQHEGYDYATGTRQFLLNPSAEWLLYKGGIYLNYRLFD